MSPIHLQLAHWMVNQNHDFGPLRFKVVHNAKRSLAHIYMCGLDLVLSLEEWCLFCHVTYNATFRAIVLLGMKG